MKAKRIHIPLFLVIAVLLAIVVFARLVASLRTTIAFSGNIKMTEVKVAFGSRADPELSLKETRSRQGRLSPSWTRRSWKVETASRGCGRPRARLDQVNTAIDYQGETVEDRSSNVEPSS
jgi:hypothetical protein